ncbi:MAG: YkgJ family cysteine cluster protein [Candidatus Bathyarchaeia archaeon]|jgi:Fe-S-cluster containining protein
MVDMQYENVIFPNSKGFHCRKCGMCCRNQPPDINFKEQKRIQAAGYKNFMQDPANPKNRNIHRKKDGSCFFFTKENTCEINSIKPSICFLEPFIIADFDYSTNKIYLDLNPYAVNNCKGILTEENVASEEIGKAAQTIVSDCLEIVAEKTGLPVTNKIVAFLARQLLNDSNFI